MLKLKQVNSLDHVAIIMDGNGRWAKIEEELDFLAIKPVLGV